MSYAHFLVSHGIGVGTYAYLLVYSCTIFISRMSQEIEKVMLSPDIQHLHCLA